MEEDLMKKFLSTFLVMCIILSVSGCVSSNNNDENGEKMNEEQVKETISGTQDDIEHQIDVAISEQESNRTETTIKIDLTTENSEIYYLNLKNDAKATLRYTYSTDDKEGASLGYYNDSDTEPTTIELLPATEEAYNAIWKEESVELEKGENTFYLIEDGIHCKMILQIEGITDDNIIYAGTVKE